MQREVALKVLHRRRGVSLARAERFIAEARAASGLNHPNIVTVFDAAFDDTTPYIASELIDGRTLRHEIARAALPVRRVPGHAGTVMSCVLLVIASDDTPTAAGDALIFAPLTSEPGYEGMPVWSPDVAYDRNPIEFPSPRD